MGVPLPTSMLLSPMLFSHLVHPFHDFIVYKQYKLQGSTLCPPSPRSPSLTPPVNVAFPRLWIPPEDGGRHYRLLLVVTFSVPVSENPRRRMILASEHLASVHVWAG